MIRVGFVLTFDATGWLGGISYFRNLLGALAALPQPRIRPVIFAGNRTDAAALAQFPQTEVIRSPVLDASGPRWLLRRLGSRVTGRDFALERLLRGHGIRVLSHLGFLGRLGRIAVLGWIPDFQERHLPEFFSAAELRARMRRGRLFCSASERVILSSHDAQRDLQIEDGACGARSRVLQFVADVRAGSAAARAEVLRRLDIRAPYLHLPNQFWVHKNHALVVDALRLLKNRGVTVQVIATGNMADHRQPRSYQALMQRVQDAGVADRFRPLGALPYHEVVALMCEATAIINPSRFEGWSTTVEEAKSLGKQILLSNLPVHREQAPARGHYFEPDDAQSLARLMETAASAHDPQVEERETSAAQAALEARRADFARRYEDIVLECIGGQFRA